MAGGTFPTSVPSYTVTVGSETANAAAGGTGLSGLLNNFETDVTALATKMGTGSATPTSGRLLRGNGAGTSTWGQLVMSTDVAAFTSADIAGVVSDETGTGLLVFGTSPTIVTPTIASFTNAQHDHTNAAGGGTLSAAAMPALALNTQTLSNPYKFSVYRSGNQSIPDAAATKVQFNAETYDTNNNFDSTINFRYTAPIAGFYHFDAECYISNETPGIIVAHLYVNGAGFRQGNVIYITGGNDGSAGVHGTISLAANDYVEVYVYQDDQGANLSKNLNGNSAATYFDGFLVSQT